MTDDYSARIQKLETGLKEIQETVRPGETPAVGIAMFIGFLTFVFIMLNLPFPQDFGFWPRFGLGVGALFAGAILYTMALGLVEIGFKIIVEVVAVLLFYLNAIALPLVIMFYSNLSQALQELDIVPDERIRIAVYLISALALFVVDVAASLILYPLAKIAGTPLGVRDA